MDNINNTGTKFVRKLIKVYKKNGLPVLDSRGRIITKANNFDDPDYIAPYEDFCDCPTPESEICGPDSNELCTLVNVHFLPISGNLDQNTHIYTFVIGVNDEHNTYQFQNPITEQWNDATIGINKTSYSISNLDYEHVIIRIRKKGCVEEKLKIVDIPQDDPIDSNSIVVVEGY